jgi:hypothetical protein
LQQLGRSCGNPDSSGKPGCDVIYFTGLECHVLKIIQVIGKVENISSIWRRLQPEVVPANFFTSIEPIEGNFIPFF